MMCADYLLEMRVYCAVSCLASMHTYPTAHAGTDAGAVDAPSQQELRRLVAEQDLH